MGICWAFGNRSILDSIADFMIISLSGEESRRETLLLIFSYFEIETDPLSELKVFLI